MEVGEGQTAVVKRAVPLVVSMPTFPQHRELLRENGPEMKRKLCEVSSRNRTTLDPSKLDEGMTRFFNIG